MSKVTVSEAIQSGDWLECEYESYSGWRNFRLRILGFEPGENSNSAEQFSKLELEGDLWILYFDVVNTGKEPFSAWFVLDSLSLIDSDGCRFDACNLSDLHELDPMLKRLADSSLSPPLSPKIKVDAAVAFLLPDQESDYRITISEGKVRKS